MTAAAAQLDEGIVPLEDEELDVLYCAATRELQTPGGSAELALGLLRQLSRACAARRDAGACNGSAVSLLEPARDAEILALDVLGRHAEAASLRDLLCPETSAG